MAGRGGFRRPTIKVGTILDLEKAIDNATGRLAKIAVYNGTEGEPADDQEKVSGIMQQLDGAVDGILEVIGPVLSSISTNGTQPVPKEGNDLKTAKNTPVARLDGEQLQILESNLGVCEAQLRAVLETRTFTDMLEAKKRTYVAFAKTAQTLLGRIEKAKKGIAEAQTKGQVSVS